MFSAIFSSPRCRKPMSGVAFVMFSPPVSATRRSTRGGAGATRVTGSGDSISRVVKAMDRQSYLRWRVNRQPQAQNRERTHQAKTNFLCRMTLAKTRAASPCPDLCQKANGNSRLQHRGALVSAVLNGFSEPRLQRNFRTHPVLPRATGTMILHGRNYRPPDCVRDASAQGPIHRFSTQKGDSPGVIALAERALGCRIQI